MPLLQLVRCAILLGVREARMRKNEKKETNHQSIMDRGGRHRFALDGGITRLAALLLARRDPVSILSVVQDL